MKLTREAKPGGPIVTGFSAGGFKVEERIYAALLLTPEWFDDWSPPPLSDLTPDAVDALLTIVPPPEFLLLGTGRTLVRPPLAFAVAIEARGFGIEAMDSRAAARAWGVLRSEGRRIVGALYPLR